MATVDEARGAFEGESLERFRCVACGYGASCRMAPIRCPMCGGAAWTYERGSHVVTRLLDADKTAYDGNDPAA